MQRGRYTAVYVTALVPLSQSMHPTDHPADPNSTVAEASAGADEARLTNDSSDNNPETADEPAEGVVQFGYALDPPPGAPLNADLIAWRELLMRQELIGQDPLRYDGYAFGNLSARLAPTSAGTLTRAADASADHNGLFIVSASQAAHRDHEDPATWTTIDQVNLPRFWVDARGDLPPSSETMTHAMIYAAEPNAQFVFHAHSPEIWNNADALQLPATAADVPYGSVAMSQAVINLLAANMSRPLVFVTKGHTDGVFALGPTARDTGGLLTSYLARALTLEAQQRTPTAP